MQIIDCYRISTMKSASSQDIDSQVMKRRQHRIVKKEIVKIDDIEEMAGANYVNWIKITKQKLIV